MLFVLNFIFEITQTDDLLRTLGAFTHPISVCVYHIVFRFCISYFGLLMSMEKSYYFKNAMQSRKCMQKPDVATRPFSIHKLTNVLYNDLVKLITETFCVAIQSISCGCQTVISFPLYSTIASTIYKGSPKIIKFI